MRTEQGQAGRARVAAAALIVATLLAGCAGSWGSYRRDADVARDFEAAQVLPGHRYYTTGSPGTPDAILALRAGRPLRDPRWREIAATPEALARLTQRMRGTRDRGPDGQVMLDAQGEPIGAWYSYATPTPPRLLEDGGVSIDPPQPSVGKPPFPPGRRAE